jgi:PAS domain-containing protein
MNEHTKLPGRKDSDAVFCAWCRKQMRGEPVDPNDHAFASHGICADCTNNFRFQEGVSLHEYMESLPFAVALLDSEMRLTFANSKACVVLGKSSDEMSGNLYGDVFECANARLPEGCGRTIHCSGCTIRRTLTNVHSNSEPQWKVPATLTRQEGTAALEISVVNSRNILWLRIDRFGKAD